MPSNKNDNDFTYCTWLYTSSGLTHHRLIQWQRDLGEVKHISPHFSVLIQDLGARSMSFFLIPNSEPFLYLSQSLANHMCQRLYAINLCRVYACPYNYGYLCSVFPPLCLSYFSLLCQPDNPDSQVTNHNHIPPHSFPSFLLWAPYALHTIGPLDSCFIRCFAHAASLSVFVLQPLFFITALSQLPKVTLLMLWGKQSLWLHKCRSLLHHQSNNLQI